MSKIFAGGLIGMLVGMFVFMAAWKGLFVQFPEKDWSNWGFLIWGEHWLLRLVVSIIATAVGGTVAGLGTSARPGVTGLLSSLPTSLIWIVIAYVCTRSDLSNIPSRWTWFTASCILAVLSPYIGMVTGRLGGRIRPNNSTQVGLIRKPLGIYWVHWIWLGIPLYYLLSEFFFSAYLTLLIDIRGSGLFWNVARVACGFTAVAIIWGPGQALILLAKGDGNAAGSWERGRIIFFFLVIIPVFSILVRTGALYLAVRLSQ